MQRFKSNLSDNTVVVGMVESLISLAIDRDPTSGRPAIHPAVTFSPANAQLLGELLIEYARRGRERMQDRQLNLSFIEVEEGAITE